MGSADAANALTEAFERLGFEPELDREQIRLRACPFRQAAREHPEVVCRVHLGLAQRLAEQAGAELQLLPFIEPELCLVTLGPQPS